MNRVALSRAITFSGGNAAFIALLAALYAATHSPGIVALGALASFAIPAMASPLAGWIGDHFDRRRVMVISEIVGAVCFLLMAIFPTAPVALLLFRAAASLAAAPLVAATAASLPGLVGPAEELPAANAKLASAGIIGALVGPLVATTLMLVSDPSSVFVFNVMTFIASVLLLVSIKADFRPSRDRQKDGRVAELAAGFRYLGTHSLLRPVTVAYGILFVGVGLTAPAEVALSADFGVGDTGYAALSCAFALGGIAGSQFWGRGALLVLPVRPIAVLAAASGVDAIGFLAVGIAPVFSIALLGMAISGGAYGLWVGAHENLVQMATPDAIRSRVFAGSEAVSLAGISLGLAAAGASISILGAAGTFYLGSLAALLGCLLLAGKTLTETKSVEISASGGGAAASLVALGGCESVHARHGNQGTA